MILVDTHNHLYSEEYMENLDSILKEAVETGVGAIICVAEDLESSRATLSLAEKYENVYAAIGMHPWTAIHQYDELKEITSLIRDYADHIVAIGEVGLDKKYDSGEKGWMRQVEAFKQMIELALELDKPLNIHSRRAASDVLELLKVYRVKKAHFHWFTDSEDILREVVSMGYYVSFTPSITYSKRMMRMSKMVPVKQLLTETDGPVPFYGPLKGELTRPCHVKLVYEKLSEIHGYKLEDLANEIYRNFSKLYLDIG